MTIDTPITIGYVERMYIRFQERFLRKEMYA